MHHLSSKPFLLFILPLISYIGVALLLTPHITQAAGNTYYVSSGQSLQNAVNQLGAADTLIINSGIYDGLVDIPASASGTSESNRTLIRVADGATVTLQPVVGFLNDVQYITLDGSNGTLVIDGQYSGYGCGICFNDNASHIRVKNVEIKHSGEHGILGSARDSEFINLHVHHNGIDENGTVQCLQIRNNPSYRGYCHGLYFTSGSSNPNNLIEGGSYHHNEAAALHMYGSDGVTVRGATIFENGLHGIWFLTGSGAGIYNNVVTRNGTIGGDAAGVGIYLQGSNAQVYNNTVYDNRIGLMMLSGGGTYRNNIVYNNSDNNIEDNGGNTLSNNLTSDPGFVNPSSGDFHLQSNSPARDAGASLPEVPCDFDGNARPAWSAYDIGAFEYGSSPGGGCSGSTSSPTPTPIPTNQPPVVTISAIPGSISVPGQGITLSWSGTNANSCTASGGWSGTQATAGNTRFTPTATTIYTLTCTGPGGEGQGSATVTVGTAVSCTKYASGSSVPAGFGVPWDVQNPSILLLNATCTSPTVLLKVGNQQASNVLYIYKTAYTAPAGANGWNPVDLFGSSLISGAWYRSFAQGVATMDTSTPSYYVGYTCSWTGSAWKCGCRDTACSQSYWQIQRIQQ